MLWLIIILEKKYFEAKPQLFSKCVSRVKDFFFLNCTQNILADTQGTVFQVITWKLGHPGIPCKWLRVRL